MRRCARTWGNAMHWAFLAAWTLACPGACSDGAANSGVDSGEDAGADSGVAGDEQCVGKPDFTRCNVVTSPDWSYDICNAGFCKSPGCGYDKSCNVPGPAYPLPDTGLTLCYTDAADAGVCSGEAGATDCATIPFCGQDAQYPGDVPNRYTRNLEVAGEPVVDDGLTGLSWQGCPIGRSGDDCGDGEVSKAKIWPDALERCEQSTWGGFDDWRLPGPHELWSLLDRIENDPPLDPDAFPGWSSVEINKMCTSSYHRLNELSGDHEFTVISLEDLDVMSMREDESCSVVCVRGDPAVMPLERFARTEPAAGEPTVLDHVTGLVWQGCTGGLSGADCQTGEATQLGWEEALSYCEGLDWGGATDWRLPNVQELFSIVDDRCDVADGEACIDNEAFPATSINRFFWTSTSLPRPPFEEPNIPFGLGKAFEVGFFLGDADTSYKPPGDEFDTDGYEPVEHPFFLVRCVR